MKRLEVELDGYGSLVRGFGSRDMVQKITGSAPVWSTIRRGWSCQERTARSVIALAENLGYHVVITGPRASAARSQEFAASKVEHADPGAGLW